MKSPKTEPVSTLASFIPVGGGRKRHIPKPLSPPTLSAVKKISTSPKHELSSSTPYLPTPSTKKKSRISEWMDTCRRIDTICGEYEPPIKIPTSRGASVSPPPSSAVKTLTPTHAVVDPCSLSGGAVPGGDSGPPAFGASISPPPPSAVKISTPKLSGLHPSFLSGCAVPGGDNGPPAPAPPCVATASPPLPSGEVIGGDSGPASSFGLPLSHYKWQREDLDLPLVYLDDVDAVIDAVNSGNGFRVSLPKSHL